MDLDKLVKNVIDKHIKTISGIDEKKNKKQLKYFLKFIQPIYNIGTIYTTGVGKSSYVAKKLASCLSLLSLKSEYLDPVNALHGDIGRVDEEQDLLIVLSNSGKTQELITLLDNCYCEMKIVGILPNSNNLISSCCKVIFETGQVEEACPYNIIPTSSIVAQLTICDMITLSLLEELELTKKDILENHPGGNIGNV